MKHDALPDFRASGRILIAALVAAVPTVALIQLHLTVVGVVTLVAGGLLYLFMYLTLAPVLGAVDKFDVTNLKTIMSFVPLQYGGAEMRFTTFTELGQNLLDQNVLEVVALDGNVIDLRLIRSQVSVEENEGKKFAARTFTVMIRIFTIFTDSVLDYEARLLSVLGRG